MKQIEERSAKAVLSEDINTATAVYVDTRAHEINQICVSYFFKGRNFSFEFLHGLLNCAILIVKKAQFFDSDIIFFVGTSKYFSWCSRTYHFAQLKIFKINFEVILGFVEFKV